MLLSVIGAVAKLVLLQLCAIMWTPYVILLSILLFAHHNERCVDVQIIESTKSIGRIEIIASKGKSPIKYLMFFFK